MSSQSTPQQRFKRFLKQVLLTYTDEITFEELEAKALNIAKVVPDEAQLSPDDIRTVIAEITAEATVKFSDSGSVVDPDTFEPWLEARRLDIETPRWDAYEKLLIDRDWDTKVIAELDYQSDEVLDLVGDPEKPGEWARRGLVIGEVQSGKTANYLALLNKALDFGYKVVIVIGGHTNELRRQTQERFDTDLLGIDSEYLEDNISNAVLPVIGIGEINPELRANVMTTVNGDFNAKRKAAGITWIDSPIPTVFVIKKNARLISNVANYIRLQAGDQKMSMPLLVVDDESDWGTPNTGSETDPTRVNKEIRRLLGNSTRSSYLGITATPFANVFIDHEASLAEAGVDLFPKDYIRALPAPTSYFGASRYFLDGNAALRTSVEDCLELIPILHKSNHQVDSLPDSLRQAVMAFVVGTAIRKKTADRQIPASMLVNVSRFNQVQSQVSDLLSDFLASLKDMVFAEFVRTTATRTSLYEEFENVWEAEFMHSAECSFDELKAVLWDVISEFRVELVNSQTAASRRRQRKTLTAEQREQVELEPTIYVGGDVLSRGITLRGLQVSYFVREPRTMDTLMQMGRWFGYPTGYAELVRVWIPIETAKDFSWSAEVTDELKQMLIEMRSRNLTPKQFGLRVRTHPEGFKIVAANKSRATGVLFEGPMLLENKLRQTLRLDSDLHIREVNYRATTRLLEAMRGASGTKILESKSKHRLWSDVPLEMLKDFFIDFHGHPSCEVFGPPTKGQPAMILNAIEEAKNSELWDVCLIDGSGNPHRYPSNDVVRTSIRNSLQVRTEDLYQLESPAAAGSSLEDSLSRVEFESLILANPGSQIGEKIKNPVVLSHLKRPRLLIFTLSVNAPSVSRLAEEVSADKPLVAVAVAFPKLDPEEAVVAASRSKKYQVNSVWLQNYSAQFEADEQYDDELEV